MQELQRAGYARAALTSFGFRPAWLLPRLDRRPNWPARIVGSISHTADYCVAVLGPWPQILGREEIAKLQVPDPNMRQRIAAITHCTKAAFYKFQYELTQAGCRLETCTLTSARNF